MSTIEGSQVVEFPEGKRSVEDYSIIRPEGRVPTWHARGSLDVVITGRSDGIDGRA